MPFFIVQENAADIDAETIVDFSEIHIRSGGIFGKKRALSRKYMEYLRQASSVQPEPAGLQIHNLGGSHKRMGEKSFRAVMSAVRNFLMESDRVVYIVLSDKRKVLVKPRVLRAVEKYLKKNYIPLSSPEYYEDDRMYGEGPAMAAAQMPAARSLDNRMEHLGETFSQMLLRLINERGLKDSEVYRKANIDRRHFSKIRSDKDYTPNKRTVLSFAIALELSLDETTDLLMRAGYAFSNSLKSDVIIRYFIEKQRYDIFEINETLFSYEQPLLG